MIKKSLLFLLLMTLFAPWAANAQSVTIGTGTNTNNYLPGYTYFKYAISQQIYTADEINASGNITSIAFYNAGTGTAANNARKFDIYMAHTTKTDFESTSDWIALTDSDIVYNGTSDVTLTPNTWTTFTLDTPFAYNGTDNLVVCVIDRSGDYTTGNHNSYLVFSTGSIKQAHYAQSDSYSSLTPNGYNGTTALTGSTIASKNQIILGGIHQVCAKPTDLAATLDATDHTIATLNWTENGESTSWVFQVATNNTFTENLQSYNISTTPTKDLTGLTPETKYYARVKPDCDTEGNLWSDVCMFKPTVTQIIPIGSGEATSQYLPAYTLNNNTLSEQIYTAEEIGMAGTINSLAFFNAGSAKSPNLKIYLVHTDKNAFSSATDWLSVTAGDLVYEGDVTLTAGVWTTIELDDTFEYDGGSNLGLIVDEHMSYSSGLSCRVFTGTTDCSMYVTSDGTDYNAVGATYSATGRLSVKNQLQIGIIPCATPKPRNLEVSNLSSSGATLTWQAPATGTPTGYEYQYKEASVTDWPTIWTSNGTNLSIPLSGLTASTPYDFRVRATYAEGNSNPVETQFTTLDNCAVPTGLAATLVTGNGTVATFSWTKGFVDDDDWVLQYGTDNTFTAGTYTEITDGFNTTGAPVIIYDATGLTAETTYYARVKTDCGGTYSNWSDVYEFMPTNYIDFTFRQTATSSTSYCPFYGYYTNSNTNQSQFIVPKSEIEDLGGGSIRSLTYYTSSPATTNWGGVIFDVYMAEVENSTFSNTTFIDWTTLGTPVYTGTVSLSGGMMVIDLDNEYTYNGGNLLIGFKTNTKGTETQSINWTAAYYSGVYNELHQYSTNDAARGQYQPKITFNYLPSPYKKPVIDEANCTFGTETAHIAWTVTGATPTGYQFQYKPSSIPSWPDTWNSISTPYKDLVALTPGTLYDFRVKALYEGGHESAVVDYNFYTDCDIVTTFPWKEDFEAYNAGDFTHPCWQNVHISGDGSSIFKVNTSEIGTNNTHKLQLPDQSNPTYTKLRLPEMTLPNNGYQFVLDVYRSHYNNVKPGEGIIVYASTDGNLEGATRLAFIPRQYDLGNDTIAAVATTGWYTYELPIPMSGTCYIILKGKNEYGQATYMDNFSVEASPACARPTGLAYSEVTNHSAKLSWTAEAGQTLWQVAYSKTAFDPNTASFDITTVSTVDVTANPFTFSNTLDAESTYYMYVRANCGTATEPDYGPWSRQGVSFTTDIACPAPTGLAYANLKSEQVDLSWTNGGAEDWVVAYKSEDDTDFTELPVATADVTISGTTVTYTLTGLAPEKEYTVKVMDNCEASYPGDGTSDFSNTITFETLAACAQPTGITVSNISHYTADLTWTGDSPEFIVNYRESAGENILFEEDFEDESSFANWTFTSMNTINGIGGSGSRPAGRLGIAAHEGSYGFRFSSYTTKESGDGVTYDQYLVSPELTVTGDLKFYAWRYGTGDKLYYGTSTTTNDLDAFTWEELTFASASSWLEFQKEITSGVKYIAFHYFGNCAYYVYLDDITIGTPTSAGSWQTLSPNPTTTTASLTGLTAGTKYDVTVTPSCDNTLVSDPATFTTLSENLKYFITEGTWSTATNWMDNLTPTISDNVVLRAKATIENGTVAEAAKITFEGSTPTLTINDGGQLKTNNAVAATVKKHITGYGAGNEEDKAHYYLIAHPLNSTIYYYNLSSTNMLTGKYDLYSWSYSNDLEWTNYEVGSGFSLSAQTGYLYANESNVDLTFTGTVVANNTDVTKSLNYSSGTYDFNGWNLVGNPFACNAYVKEGSSGVAYYRMNTAGNGFTAATGAIAPMEGIFVQATAASQSFKFTRTNPEANPGNGNLNICLAQTVTTRGEQGDTDNAIVQFGEGNTLGKFSFREDAAKIYIPQDGKDYAVVNAEAQGELPVYFKTYSNGNYTLSFTAQDVDFSYLHLVDNLTGNDVDLLATPSYNFDARFTDYAARFKLVFCKGNANGEDNFGFISDGQLILTGLTGGETLQVIDALGRVITSTNAFNHISTENMAPGVYVLRLINGNDVKTQKIVVR